VREVRRAFGAHASGPAPSSAVPWFARAALWCAAGGLAWLEWLALRA
jgi:hypothetical protein